MVAATLARDAWHQIGDVSQVRRFGGVESFFSRRNVPSGTKIGY